MTQSSFLIVKRGAPFEAGSIIELTTSLNVILGREGAHWTPGVSFDNAFISRKHVTIYYNKTAFYIKDLGSKHGSYLNKVRLEPNKPLELKQNDSITLANEMVILSFSTHNIEETMDLSPFFEHELEPHVTAHTLDPYKQTLQIADVIYTFSEKEYKFVEILLENQQEFVSKNEIKKYVWAERNYSSNCLPDVSSEEMNAIVYRLRKKVHDHLMIETVRGKGYIVKINSLKK